MYIIQWCVCCTGGSNNPSLWVGTNGGHVYVYSLTVPGSDKRSVDAVGCVLAKEIKLKHHAPVISIAVIDSKNRVLPEALEVINERAKAPDMEGQHSVIICSEEQLKVWRSWSGLQSTCQACASERFPFPANKGVGGQTCVCRLWVTVSEDILQKWHVVAYVIG